MIFIRVDVCIMNLTFKFDARDFLELLVGRHCQMNYPAASEKRNLPLRRGYHASFRKAGIQEPIYWIPDRCPG